MSKASKEIECIKRLDELCAIYDEVLDFLIKENLVSREDSKAIKSSSEIPKMIHTTLANLSRTNKLQLLEYEWVVLPVERLKISIVTDRMSKEFSFNY